MIWLALGSWASKMPNRACRTLKFTPSYEVISPARRTEAAKNLNVFEETWAVSCCNLRFLEPRKVVNSHVVTWPLSSWSRRCCNWRTSSDQRRSNLGNLRELFDSCRGWILQWTTEDDVGCWRSTGYTPFLWLPKKWLNNFGVYHDLQVVHSGWCLRRDRCRCRAA